MPEVTRLCNLLQAENLQQRFSTCSEPVNTHVVNKHAIYACIQKM